MISGKETKIPSMHGLVLPNGFPIYASCIHPRNIYLMQEKTMRRTIKNSILLCLLRYFAYVREP